MEGKKTKIRKEKRRVTCSYFMAILAAQSENRQLKDLPQAYFGRVPEGFLLSVRTNSVIENFVYWKLGPLFFFAFFFVDSTPVFFLSAPIQGLLIL